MLLQSPFISWLNMVKPSTVQSEDPQLCLLLYKPQWLVRYLRTINYRLWSYVHHTAPSLMTSGPGTGMKSALSGVVVGHHQPLRICNRCGHRCCCPREGCVEDISESIRQEEPICLNGHVWCCGSESWWRNAQPEGISTLATISGCPTRLLDVPWLPPQSSTTWVLCYSLVCGYW